MAKPPVLEFTDDKFHVEVQYAFHSDVTDPDEGAPPRQYEEAICFFSPTRRWETHPTCEKINQWPYKRTMQLCRFDRTVRRAEAIRAMLTAGCRPATHHELFALAQSHPELFDSEPIVAVGSLYIDDSGTAEHLILSIDDCEVYAEPAIFGTYGTRFSFLVVRTSKHPKPIDDDRDAPAHELAARLVALAKAKNLPASVIQCLLTDEGQELLDMMLAMAHADVLSEQLSQSAIASAVAAE